MHILLDTDVGNLGVYSNSRREYPAWNGYGTGIKTSKNEQGDGGIFRRWCCADEGDVPRSLNFAALKKLPVVYVCENNLLRDKLAPACTAGRTTILYRWAEITECRASRIDEE